jgi:MoaA/NifB/PqqE/SkfB family radical SAM enzyme
VKAYARLAANILGSNFGRRPQPYKLTFVTTYWCNYKCKTCNIWERKPKDELTLEEIDRFFSKSQYFQWIDFTGGEPWLRRDFPEIVESALAHCPDLVLVHFPTNGYLTKRIVEGTERILRKRPRKLIVTVSTDGDEAVNDEIRGKEGGWRKQIDTYKQLHAMKGVEVVLGMTLSSLNADQYEKAFAAAKAECPWLGPRDYHVNVVHESNHYYGNEGTKGLRDRKDVILDQVHRYRLARGTPRGVVDFLEHRYLQKAEQYLRTGMTPMRCHALRSSCFVDSWGDVYPCGMYTAKVASLREHDYDLSAIWNLPRARTLQEEIWDYQCPQCWTPCEAYQSIFGNLLGMRDTPSGRGADTRGQPRAGEGFVPVSSLSASRTKSSG